MDSKAKILDIAMNLNRVGNLAADGYALRKNRIRMFLNETTQYLEEVRNDKFPKNFRKTFEVFIQDYEKLEKEANGNIKDEFLWAEKMMTWGNILTHRSKLI